MFPDNSKGSWFIPLNSNPSAHLRLFCFPYAGGAPNIFQGWHLALSPSIEFYTAQYPGRGIRWMETPISKIELLIEKLADNIIPYLDRPYALLGHSMGALVIFELTRELRHRGMSEPAWLFPSAFRAPQIPHQGRILHTMPDEQFLQELKRIDGTPPEVLQDRELMEILLPTIRADFSVCELYSYQVEKSFNCPISVWGGLQDQDVNPIQLQEWRQQTYGPFKTLLFPGDHFFIKSAKYQLLNELDRDLKSI